LRLNNFLFLFVVVPLFGLENNSYIGGVAVVDVGDFTNKPKIFYKSREVKSIKEDEKYFAIVGIGLDEKVGKRHIVAVVKDQKKDFYFDVKSKGYKKEYIKLKSNKRVNLSKKNLSRYQKERKKTKKLLASFNKELSTSLNFISPLTGRLSSPFGKRRYFNNVPKSPHKGVDIAAKKGTPIVATQSGIVSIREEYFFNGNTIYLDHGEGVVSVYCHMQKFAVRVGDFVEQGDVIGYVGTTGRSTGPHLHFGLMLNGEAVDPSIFIKKY
jgi:murein DD-endopeptidase MepM/ murein hydrolase activator NlpD